MVATPERVRPKPVVALPGLPELPKITVYPLVDLVADKVCAMYERHGATVTASTRFRDLHDLVLIVQSYELDAVMLDRAVAAESARRGLTLSRADRATGATVGSRLSRLGAAESTGA